jgi:hypothetical protein
MKRIILSSIAAAALCGCINVTASRTTTGTNTTDSISVRAFLETINQGTYGTSNGLYLTTTQTTPDQQSIAILAGAVVDLGKSGMALAATQQTNSPTK